MAVRRHAVTSGERPPAQATDEDSRAALGHLYEEQLTAVYRFVYSKVGNREEAEDLTSQVFLKALRDLDQSRAAGSIQAWLFQVARTTIADHWRRFYRLRVNSLDDLLAGGLELGDGRTADLASAQPDVRVHRLMEHLSDRYREVLTYRFLRNYSVSETAAAMQLSEANIKVLQFRALKRAGQLEQEMFP